MTDMDYEDLTMPLKDPHTRIMLNTSFTDADEFIVMSVNPTGENDYEHTFNFKVPYLEFEILEIQRDGTEVKIGDYDKLSPTLFDPHGKHFSPVYHEVAMPIQHKIGDLIKIYKIKNMSGKKGI